MRASRSLDIPTSSGFARGKSAAKTMLEARKQSVVASSRRPIMKRLPFGLYGPLERVCQQYR
jgi:hypothetical protein